MESLAWVMKGGGIDCRRPRWCSEFSLHVEDALAAAPQRDQAVETLRARKATWHVHVAL